MLISDQCWKSPWKCSVCPPCVVRLKYVIVMYNYVYHCRLQQPVQNPISDNTNVLWNSTSLGKIYSYRLLWFYKTTPILSFEGKKTGPNSSIFSGITHYLGCVKKQPKISGIALF